MTAPIAQSPAPTAADSTREKTVFEQLLEKDSKTEMWIKPVGEEDEVKLSVDIVRKYIAEPYFRDDKTYEAPREECIKFILMCRGRKLDPFTGDAFMIPFWDDRTGKPKWSLITSHAAMLKRAELHKDFDGMDSGIIVMNDKQLIEREGDFLHPGDQLLGGWSIVFSKTKTHPKKIKVNLTTYAKGFGVWKKDSAGMICKVAECQGIRDSYPTQTGGMYLREEMDGAPEVVTEIKRPVIDAPETAPVKQPRKRPTMVEEPLDKPVVSVPPEPSPEPKVNAVHDPTKAREPVDPQVEERPEATIMRLATGAGITNEQLIVGLRKEKWMTNPAQTKLSELAEAKLKGIVKAWTNQPEEFVKRIQKANEK